MIKDQTMVAIDDSFRELIKNQNYERYVLAIINKSQEIFQDIEFRYIENQSHGESDFQDSNGQYYDAKLLFDKKQGQLLGDSKNKFADWIHELSNEKIEFGRYIKERGVYSVACTRLYQIMKERLASVKPDENAIFFIPFPIVNEYKDSLFIQCTTDFLQAVYDKLVEDEMVGNRKVYFIYPSGDAHEYVLRDNNRRREDIKCEELDNFISFETRQVIENND